jgi:hypothetical protein
MNAGMLTGKPKEPITSDPENIFVCLLRDGSEGLSCCKIFQPDGLMGSCFHAFAVFDQEKLRRLMLHPGIERDAVGDFAVIEKIEVPGRKVIAGFRLPAAVDAIKCHGADGASCAVFKNKDRLMVGCFQ